MLVINIPLFLAGVKIMGMTFGIRTIYGIVSLSVFTDLLQPHMTALTDDLLLASIYGGVIGGIGLGIVFRSRGTTGGTDLIASLINYFTGIFSIWKLRSMLQLLFLLPLRQLMLFRKV
jgi:uncharacterized membrane-anchored protein YitT (DUF2179 family)